MRTRTIAIPGGVVALALAGALACGADDRQAKLDEARERVDRAEERLVAAEHMLEERREELETARERFESAKERVAEAETELGEAREQVAAFTSDALLFRSVQRRLLDDEALEPAAVSAAVDDGVVTLTGEVPEEPLRERAVKLARETPGVLDVVDRIEVVEVSGEGV